MKKFLVGILCLYLVVSVALSVAYNVSDFDWDIAEKRGVFLVAGLEDECFFILSPFCCYCDVFLFGIDWSETGLRLFSDGFYCFGEYWY